MKRHAKNLFLKAALLLVSVTALYVPTDAQPGCASGVQVMQLQQQACMRRIKMALEAEGYTVQTQGTDMATGYKYNITAVINCNTTPQGMAFINVFVASTSSDASVPEAEKQRLQSRINMGSQPNFSDIRISWATTAKAYRGKIGQRFTFYIPPNGMAYGSLWGTDTYTDDSSIGLAAIHAGLITAQSGGTVTIEIRSGLTTYQGSTRNGIKSSNFGNWAGSFVFVW